MHFLHAHELVSVVASSDPSFDLSASFQCSECRRLRYGTVQVCRKCRYYLCSDCSNQYLEALKKASMDLSAQEQPVSLVESPRGEDANLDAFMEACVVGNFTVVKNRVERSEFHKGFDIEAIVESGRYRGRTALSLACEHGHREIVAYLLSRGANPESIDNDGMTSLMHAAYRGHLSVVNELLLAHSSVHRVSFAGYTPLHLSASSGHVDCLRRLVNAGAVISARTANGRTALIIAALNGHLDCVQYLVTQTEIDPTATDEEGYDALRAAIARKHNRIELFLRSN
jgi:ankyrin repeat protein